MFITQAKTVTAEMIKIINTSFTQTYEEYYRPVDTGWFEAYYIIKKNHKYQVWLCGKVRKKLVAKNISHRREALAVIKLLKATQEN
jgi:DUF1009 family protein